MTRRALLLGFTAFAVAMLLLGGNTQRARANGVPQLVKLTYLEGVSNFGPKEAEGVLEFSFAEAYARIDVKNLPQPDGYTWEGWLMGGGAAPLLVGAITVNASGIGTLDTKLEGLDNYDYNLFVVSARGAATAEGSKPADTSIAGRFTIISDATGAGVAGDVRPGQLPDTGEEPGMSQRQRIGRTITIAAAAGGLVFGFTRILHRRRASDD